MEEGVTFPIWGVEGRGSWPKEVTPLTGTLTHSHSLTVAFYVSHV